MKIVSLIISALLVSTAPTFSASSDVTEDSIVAPPRTMQELYQFAADRLDDSQTWAQMCVEGDPSTISSYILHFKKNIWEESTLRQINFNKNVAQKDATCTALCFKFFASALEAYSEGDLVNNLSATRALRDSFYTWIGTSYINLLINCQTTSDEIAKEEALNPAIPTKFKTLRQNILKLTKILGEYESDIRNLVPRLRALGDLSKHFGGVVSIYAELNNLFDSFYMYEHFCQMLLPSYLETLNNPLPHGNAWDSPLLDGLIDTATYFYTLSQRSGHTKTTAQYLTSDQLDKWQTMYETAHDMGQKAFARTFAMTDKPDEKGIVRYGPSDDGKGSIISASKDAIVDHITASLFANMFGGTAPKMPPSTLSIQGKGAAGKDTKQPSRGTVKRQRQALLKKAQATAPSSSSATVSSSSSSSSSVVTSSSVSATVSSSSSSSSSAVTSSSVGTTVSSSSSSSSSAVTSSSVSTPVSPSSSSSSSAVTSSSVSAKVSPSSSSSSAPVKRVVSSTVSSSSSVSSPSKPIEHQLLAPGSGHVSSSTLSMLQNVAYDIRHMNAVKTAQLLPFFTALNKYYNNNVKGLAVKYSNKGSRAEVFAPNLSSRYQRPSFVVDWPHDTTLLVYHYKRFIINLTRRGIFMD